MADPDEAEPLLKIGLAPHEKTLDPPLNLIPGKDIHVIVDCVTVDLENESWYVLSGIGEAVLGCSKDEDVDRGQIRNETSHSRLQWSLSLNWRLRNSQGQWNTCYNEKNLNLSTISPLRDWWTMLWKFTRSEQFTDVTLNNVHTGLIRHVFPCTVFHFANVSPTSEILLWCACCFKLCFSIRCFTYSNTLPNDASVKWVQRS